MVVVVCLTDSSPSVRSSRASALAERYRPRLLSGTLQVVSPPHSIYPPWLSPSSPSAHGPPPSSTYGDGPRATRWRAKLALDFAFLFSYCAGIPATYYLHLVRIY